MIKNLLQKAQHNWFIISIFLIILIPKLIGLGYDNYGIDAHLWDARSDRFVDAILERDFINTNQKYHPGVTVMWLSGFSKYIFHNVFNWKFGYTPSLADGVVYPELFFLNLLVAVLPIVLLITILFTYAFHLLEKSGFPKKFLYLFAVFLSLEPFLLGMTRFYHLTGLEATTGFTSLVTAYYYGISGKKRYLVGTSFIFALGMLTKTSVFIFLPLIGISLVLGRIKDKKINVYIFFQISIKSLFPYTLFLLLTCVFIFIMWPALWVKPFWVIQDVYNSGISDTAFGDNPSPSLTNNRYLYYYEMFFLRSTGLAFITFLLSAFTIFKSKSKNKWFLILNFLFLPYYAFILALPQKQIDRYAAVLLPSALFCSAYFYYYLVSKYKKFSKYLIFILLFYYAVIHWVYYPNYSSPINELFGGPANYSKYDKMKNRGEFYLQLTEYLNKRDGKEAYNKVVVVPHGGKDLSAKGYLGSIYTHDGLAPRGKMSVDYYAPDYLDFAEIPTNRDCSKIKEFGYRWPLKFTYLYVYECN